MSPDAQSQISTAKTIYLGFADFKYETLEENNGHATIIRFKLDEPQFYTAGDVLVVMDESEFYFHGMIGRIEDGGMAIASDPRGSLLPAGTVS